MSDGRHCVNNAGRADRRRARRRRWRPLPVAVRRRGAGGARQGGGGTGAGRPGGGGTAIPPALGVRRGGGLLSPASRRRCPDRALSRCEPDRADPPGPPGAVRRALPGAGGGRPAGRPAATGRSWCGGGAGRPARTFRCRRGYRRHRRAARGRVGGVSRPAGQGGCVGGRRRGGGRRHRRAVWSATTVDRRRVGIGVGGRGDDAYRAPMGRRGARAHPDRHAGAQTPRRDAAGPHGRAGGVDHRGLRFPREPGLRRRPAGGIPAGRLRHRDHEGVGDP